MVMDWRIMAFEPTICCTTTIIILADLSSKRVKALCGEPLFVHGATSPCSLSAWSFAFARPTVQFMPSKLCRDRSSNTRLCKGMKALFVFATRSPVFVAQLKSSRRCVRLCFWRGLWVKDTPGNPLAVHKHVSTDTTVFAQACICAEHNFWAHLESAYLTRAWAMGESYTGEPPHCWLYYLRAEQPSQVYKKFSQSNKSKCLRAHLIKYTKRTFTFA